MSTIGRFRSHRGALLGLALSLGLALLWPATTRAEDVVKLGVLRVISNAGMYIAMEKGFYKEEGIRNEVATFASAGKMVQPLTAGELEVISGTASAGLFNAIRQGAQYRIVADKGQAREGTGYVLLTVRKDLVDSGQVKSVKDLKGKKVALFAKGIIQSYLMGKMAEAEGLTIKDFDITYLSPPNQLKAFQGKAIEAAQTAEPWGARFAEQGLAVKFMTPEKVPGLGPVQIAAIIYSGKFIQERHDVAQRWMNAYIKGCRYYVERGAQDDEIAAIIEKHTKVPAAVVKAAIPYYQDPNGRLNLESLADQIKWFVANGYMKEPVAVEQVVDLSFLKK